MRLSHLAGAATITLSLQATTPAAFQPQIPKISRNNPLKLPNRQVSKDVESCRSALPHQVSIAELTNFRLGSNLPTDYDLAAKSLIHELIQGENLRPVLDTLNANFVNYETGQAMGLLLGTACLFLYLDRAEHDAPDEPKADENFSKGFPKKLKDAHDSLVSMGRKRLTKETVQGEIDVLLKILNRGLGGGSGNNFDPDNDDPDNDDPDFCSLPIYWQRLGLAYNRTTYGNENSPRIVVNTSLHPDLSRPGCPFDNVKYVITHSDRSGQLCVSVVPKAHQLDDGDWYQALMRDEVLAEFVRHPQTCEPYLIFRTHVGKGDHGKGSSAEDYLESLRGWSSAPGWQNLVTNLTKSWLRARLTIFDTHRFHPVEGLLEVLDPSFELNKEWQDAQVVWVNQSGDPDFNTMHEVGSVNSLLQALRSTSEQQKQQKHVENREKAWRDMSDGAKDSMKSFFRNIAMYWTRPENLQLRNELEHALMIMVMVIHDLHDPGQG